jgi:hypothetical protein
MPRLPIDYVLSKLESLERGCVEILKEGMDMSSLEAWRRILELEITRLFGVDHPYSSRVRRAVRRMSLVDCNPMEASIDRATALTIRVNDVRDVIRGIIDDVEARGVPSTGFSMASVLSRFVILKDRHPLAFWISFIGAIASIVGLVLAVIALR